MNEVQPLTSLFGNHRLMGNPIRSGTDDPIFKWRDCPHCGGRGYFTENPFADKCAVLHRQCLTCLNAHEELTQEQK